MPIVLLAAVCAAALAVAQVLLSELLGLTTLGVPLEAGGERMQGVQNTVVIWFCAVSVPVAVWLATLRRAGSPRVRAVAALAASVAVFAVLPVVRWRSVEWLRDEALGLVLPGAVLGAAAALAVVWLPRIGAGLAAHLGLVFLLGAVFALTGDVYFYAGLAESTAWGVLPAVLALTVLAAATARLVRRPGGAGRWPAVAVAVAGPVLAVAAYRAAPDNLYLYNEDGQIYAAFVVVVAFVAALVATVVPRRG